VWWRGPSRPMLLVVDRSTPGPEPTLVKILCCRQDMEEGEEQSTVDLRKMKFNTLAYTVHRALAERKYRLVLRRPASISHLPYILKFRLFLSSDDKDYLDSVKCKIWLTLYKSVESFYQQLRQAQMECIAIVDQEREVDTYEKKLSHDIERAGGGGLVRSLGGPRAASNKLDETRSQLDALKANLKNLKNEIEHIQVSV
jgi:hypothetical protein